MDDSLSPRRFSLQDIFLYTALIGVLFAFLTSAVRGHREESFAYFCFLAALAAVLVVVLGALHLRRGPTWQRGWWLTALSTTYAIANASALLENFPLASWFWETHWIDPLNLFLGLSLASVAILVVILSIQLLLKAQVFSSIALWFHSATMLTMAGFDFYVAVLIGQSAG